MQASRAIRNGLTALLLAGATAACGGDQPAGGPTPAGTDEPGHPLGVTLVVIRSGGIAGFRDTVRVPPERQATIIRRTGDSQSCRPDPAAVERLRRLDLAAVGPAPRPSTPVADAFRYTITLDNRSATATEGERGRRAELVDAAAAVVASCLTTRSGQGSTGTPR